MTEISEAYDRESAEGAAGNGRVIATPRQRREPNA
jgi:hypothetical protein